METREKRELVEMLITISVISKLLAEKLLKETEVRTNVKDRRFVKGYR